MVKKLCLFCMREYILLKRLACIRTPGVTLIQAAIVEKYKKPDKEGS